MAPRLRPAGAPSHRQAGEHEARRMKARVAELEQRIAEKEQAVRELEHLMASPGFYKDRARAERAAADHRALTAEVAELMDRWETLQAATETNT